MDLSKNRQDHIDSLVDRLRQDYGVPPDWQRVAVDNKIQYVIDDRFVVPVSGKTDADQLFVAVQDDFRTPAGKWFRAHEFGHLLLGHPDSSLSMPLREQEADYFAKRIIGSELDMASAYAQTVLNVLMHPIMSLVAAFGPRQVYNSYALSILKR